MVHCCSEENVLKSTWKYGTVDIIKLLFYDTKSQLQLQGPRVSLGLYNLEQKGKKGYCLLKLYNSLSHVLSVI